MLHQLSPVICRWQQAIQLLTSLSMRRFALLRREMATVQSPAALPSRYKCRQTGNRYCLHAMRVSVCGSSVGTPGASDETLRRR